MSHLRIYLGFTHCVTVFLSVNCKINTSVFKINDSSESLHSKCGNLIFPLLIINIWNTCFFTRNFCFKYWMTKFSQTKEAPQFSMHQTAMLAHKECFEAAIVIRTATIKFHNPSSKFSLDSRIHSKTSYCKSG